MLRRAAAESDRIVRPLDDNYFDFFETRYDYLRQFTPTFLDTFTFHANQSAESLLKAVDLLQQLNTTHRRTVPDEAPTDFVTLKWRPYVVAPDGHIDRHYYELCTLWELRGYLEELEESDRPGDKTTARVIRESLDIAKRRALDSS